MRNLSILMASIAVMAFLTLGGVNPTDVKAQTAWELWPDPTSQPPADQLEFLPIMPTGENAVMVTETDSSWIGIDVHQTREKDGKLYKAIQLFRDMDLEVTVPVGKYLFGLLAMAYPPGTGVDSMGMLKAFRLVSIELDGTVIPIDLSTYLHPAEIDYSAAGGGIWPGAQYNVFPRFTTPGTHTYKQIWKQEEEFFYLDVYEEVGLVDPSPEFERRRVLVGEQVGNPVDGNMVYTYTLTVVEKPTAVTADSWGKIKSTFR